jgi:hypothetical protein
MEVFARFDFFVLGKGSEVLFQNGGGAADRGGFF